MKQIRNLVIPAMALFMAMLLGGQTPAPAKKSSPAAATATAQQIDINAGSIDELKSIPGIGDAYANKILAGRPYKNKAQLKSRHILPDGVYEKVKDRIVAKQK